VNGWVRVKLYKGNVIVAGRDSKSDSLFDANIATFEDDRGAYDQMDAAGFIRLNALRMRIAAKVRDPRGAAKVRDPQGAAQVRGPHGTAKLRKRQKK
jgi:hypothetical protein